MKYSICPKASVIMMNCTPEVRSDRKPTARPASAAAAMASGHMTSAALLPLQPNSVSPWPR
ncbi:hypothetical protein D3C85_1509860 [compost metagenome]